MSSSSDVPLGSIDLNVSSASTETTKSVKSLRSGREGGGQNSSKLKMPTPVSCFKRPGHLLNNDTDVKRSRFDLSKAIEGGAVRSKNRSNLRRSISLSSVRGQPRVPIVGSDHFAGVRKGEPKQHVVSSQKNEIRKAPSVSCILAASKAKNVSAPVTTCTKRKPWDLKGRMQDSEESLNQMRTQNNDLLSAIKSYNERLTALEERNLKLTDEARVKETFSLEKANEAEMLRQQLKEKTEACVLYETEKIASRNVVARLQNDLTQSQRVSLELETTISSMSASQMSLNALLSTARAEQERLAMEVARLQGNVDERESLIESLNGLLAEKENKIREDEGIRRHLHNTIQELKGNIRVFCRVRPPLRNETSCEISYATGVGHSVEFVKPGELAEGSKCRVNSNNKFAFTFDQVFDQTTSQKLIFDEVSQLIQARKSALDGYNVCVFAYGQTGSGKTFTMEGDRTAQTVGMIPRTVSKIFESIKSLESRGWTYEMEASFLEIYNETIRDLLGNPNEDATKHDIKMVDTKGSDVYVTNINVVKITSEEQVSSLLQRAQKNRAVAATRCNERSSRSHSVFRLRLVGRNSFTMESCRGDLNLVDLAGSERLKESQSEGERLKETKSINKSLSNLSNVINALAQKSDHVPYRNSKLTHLLMNSLGGNSKTLMFVNVSPSEDNFCETINSLRFATKVNQCQIGCAQKK